MRLPIRFLLAGLTLLLAQRAHAQGPNPMTAVRASHWAEAQAIVSGIADPVARKVVLYMRLLAPGAATAWEIADFMQRNPDWPDQIMLERRRQEAIAADPDDASVLAQCDPGVSLAAAMLRCAEAMANAGRTADADRLARKAWVEAIDTARDEAAFPRRWDGIATEDDQWARFQRLAWLSDPSAAARQSLRLTGQDRTAAEARLAAKRDDPRTEELAAALPPARRDDPGLVLDRARALRHSGQTADAAALLAHVPDALNPSAFWAERNLLARALLRDGDAATAYGVAAAPAQTSGKQRLDADFLAGFIALRMLHDPVRAAVHFHALANSWAAITLARAHYWLARTDAAAGRDPRPEYEQAAAWPTAFYGQLAILALGESPAARIGKLHDPVWTRDAALAFTEHEVLRAAAWLIAWGEAKRARRFLVRMDELAPIAAERALTAAFATNAGMPDGAVFVARRMGRDGIPLPHLGWPAPYDPASPPDPAFSLGIMRQESSFDIAAVSPSGARGLMQLMPPTATAVAKELGVPAAVPRLTVNAGYNIQLGSAYLHDMLTRFDNCLPLATAAYNAGPHRVAQWLEQNGDPRTGPIDMVDWIELIPSEETRNYVQRVSENVVMYRAQRNDPSPVLRKTPWTR